MKVLNIFPLSIFCNKINLTDKKKKQMIDEIRKMEENSKLKDYKKKGDAWTGDTQGFENLQKNKIFDEFFSEVKKNVYQYLDQLKIDTDQLDVFIQRSWATISYGNETIAKHKHMQSHISFAYYLKKNSNDANLMIYDEVIRNEVIPGLFGSLTAFKRKVLKELNVLNASQYTINVKEDDIIIFPSKTLHATQPTNTNDERISISADIVCIAKSSEVLEHLTPPFENWTKM